MLKMLAMDGKILRVNNEEVVDDLDKVIGINDGEIEDLIIELVNRLKPAHCNALVKFSNKSNGYPFIISITVEAIHVARFT